MAGCAEDLRCVSVCGGGFCGGRDCIPAIRGVWQDSGGPVDRLLKGDGVLVRVVLERKALLLGMSAP